MLLKLICSVCRASTAYTDNAHKRLLEATNGEKGFYVNANNPKDLNLEDELVATLNSLEHVYQHVSKLPRELDFELNHHRHSNQKHRSSITSVGSSVGGGEDEATEVETVERLNETVNEALDVIDVVVYSCLETLQVKEALYLYTRVSI